MNDLRHRLQKDFDREASFVVFSRPGNKSIRAYFPSLVDTVKGQEPVGPGFLFNPFHQVLPSIVFKHESSEVIEVEGNVVEVELNKRRGAPTIKDDASGSIDAEKVLQDLTFKPSDTAEKERYINLIRKAKRHMKQNQVSKIVLSRKEELDHLTADPLDIFFDLLSNHSNAFVYLFNHPDAGTWAGASPETLIEADGGHFRTVSLAGTQVYQIGEEARWSEKEREEQQLVTDLLKQELEGFRVRIGEPETVRAGHLLHLKTKVEGEIGREMSLGQLIDRIHPTAAICGLPRDAAREFILENEGYERDYYSGYLGEIGVPTDDRAQLFVNLRCMRLFKADRKAWVYVGGGITASSDPEKEWEETVEKTRTLKRVLF